MRPHWRPMGRARPRARSPQWCLRVPCPRGAPAPARPSRPHHWPCTPPRPAPPPRRPRRPRCPQHIPWLPPPQDAASSPGCLGPRPPLRLPLRPQVGPRRGPSGCGRPKWCWCWVLGPRKLPQPGMGSPTPGWAACCSSHISPLFAGTDPTPAAEAPAKVQDVEDFVPADGLDHGFLDDTAPPKDEKRVGAEVPQDSDR